MEDVKPREVLQAIPHKIKPMWLIPEPAIKAWIPLDCSVIKHPKIIEPNPLNNTKFPHKKLSPTKATPNSLKNTTKRAILTGSPNKQTMGVLTEQYKLRTQK